MSELTQTIKTLNLKGTKYEQQGSKIITDSGAVLEFNKYGNLIHREIPMVWDND